MKDPIVGNIYDYPNLYDALFSDQYRCEIQFLTSFAARFGRKKGDISMFEPACGSGRLL